MSNGRTHATITTALIVPTAYGIGQLTHDPDLAVLAGLGCFTGLWVEPDLDVKALTHSEYNALRKWGIFGLVWVMLWFPYAFFLRHRSPFSHWPILGTLGRIAYLFCIGFILAALTHTNTRLVAFLNVHQLQLWIFILGLMVADTAHYLADISSTKIKRFKR